MIHSNKDTGDEDYWYANETCQIYTSEIFPCQEIYFKKNTDIPLRSAEVVRRNWDLFHEITEYNLISIGKPDEKLFNGWFHGTCDTIYTTFTKSFETFTACAVIISKTFLPLDKSYTTFC